MKKVILFAICACLSTVVSAQSANAGQAKTKPANEALQANSKEHPAAVFNQELLWASWKGGEHEYTFNQNGTSQIKIDGRTCPGTWVLEDKTLTVTPKKLMWKKSDPCGEVKVLEVISLSANRLRVFETTEKKELHLKKGK